MHRQTGFVMLFSLGHGDRFLRPKRKGYFEQSLLLDPITERVLSCR
jgi:hypothetical protein